jgi:nitroreductase
VPETLVREILEVSRWAPSGCNLQPWKVAVVSGTALDEIVAIARNSGTVRFGNITDSYPLYPPSLWDPYRSRRDEVAEAMYRSLHIPRADREARLRHVARNFAFFGSPCALFFIIDRRFYHGQWAHLGMFMQSVALAAFERGLATCMQEAWALYRPELARYFELSPDDMVYCGMAIGYPNTANPVNAFERKRVDVDEFASFHGFNGDR